MEKEKIMNIKYHFVSLFSGLREKCLSVGKCKVFAKWFKISPHVLTIVFLLSLFCCFSKPLPFSLFGTQFNAGFYFSLIGIGLFGIELVFKNCGKEIARIVWAVLFVFILLFLSSFAMALIQYPFFKDFREYNYWFEFLKGIIKWSYNAICFCFIAYSLKYLKPNHLIIWTYVSTYIFLILTIIQFFIFLNINSTFADIYDKVNFLHLLNDSSFIARVKNNNGSFRAFGFSSEPAGVQFYSCAIWIPCYLWGCFKQKISKPRLIFHIFSFVIAIGLIIMTASSSVYVFAFAIVVVLLWRLLFNENVSKKKKILLLVSSGILISVLFIVPFSRELITHYFTKVLDLSNQSTLHRYSSLWNAICIFAKFHLFGVGDGFQGLYYFDNMIGSVFQHNLETQAFMFEGIGLSGGGAMIPTIMSGFGSLGLFIFIIYIIYSVKACRSNPNHFCSYLFLTTLLGAILSFTVSAGIYFSFYALFYFALPLVNYRFKDIVEYQQETFYSITI